MKALVSCTHPEARAPRCQLCPECKRRGELSRVDQKRSEATLYNQRYYKERKDDPAYMMTITAWSRSRTPADQRQYAADERLHHPGRARGRQIKHKYGITLQQYDALLEFQRAVCAICGDEPAASKPLCVDHDHETGEVRGLLCRRCNAALGMLKERADLLASAHEYLLRPTARAVLAKTAA